MTFCPAPPQTFTFLTIPKPPSVNALYRNLPGRGRVKSSAYKDWASHAGWVLKSQKPARIDGRVIVIINVERGSMAADIDNLSKATFDLLVDHKLIKNDNQVTAFAMAWAPKGEGLMRLMIMPATDLHLTLNLEADGASGGWFVKAPEQGPDLIDGY